VSGGCSFVDKQRIIPAFRNAGIQLLVCRLVFSVAVEVFIILYRNLFSKSSWPKLKLEISIFMSVVICKKGMLILYK